MDTHAYTGCLPAPLPTFDQVYVASASLGSDAVVSFVAALVAVSRDELAEPAAPRVFSLTKLVEVAHYNLGRIRWVVVAMDNAVICWLIDWLSG